MKIQHYTLLFSILFLVICVEMEHIEEKKETDRLQKLQYTEAIQYSVDKAVKKSVAYQTDRLFLDEQEALEIYWDSLFAKLAITDQYEKQEMLRSQMMFFVVVDSEGYKIWRNKCGEDTYNGWSDKEFFSEEDISKCNYGKALENMMKELTMQYCLTEINQNKLYLYLLSEDDNCFWKRGMIEPGALVMMCPDWVTDLKGEEHNQTLAGAVLHHKNSSLIFEGGDS